MRRPATTLTLATLAAVLLTGCTSEIAGSASLAADAVAPEPSDAERQEAFCTDVPELLADITGDLEDVQTDPSTAAATLDDAVSRMEAVQPPDDVAGQWDRLVTAWQDLRDLVASVRPGDAGAAQDLADQLLDLQPELVSAGTAVDRWGQANC